MTAWLSLFACALSFGLSGCASSPATSSDPPPGGNNPTTTDPTGMNPTDGGGQSTVDGSGPPPAPGTPVERTATIKTSVANTYVGAENGGGGTVYADRFVPQAWETFKLVDLNGNTLQDGDAVNLRTNDGHFLSAANGAVNAAATAAGATETFTVGLISKVGGATGNTIGDGDSLSFKVAAGSYLSATNGGGAGLVANVAAVKTFETFLLGPAAGLPTVQSTDGWTLTWSDEFDGPAGPIDGNKWNSEVNGSPANAELEYYTNRQSNIAVDGNGNLNLIARAESYMNHNYTSGRVNTAGKFTQAYGRFDARVQMPTGKGIWPAFWMLGNNIGDPNIGWPQCGELDIMETVGTDTTHNYGSAHGPGYSGGNPLTAGYTYPGGSLTDGFHVFSLEWEPNVVRWYVDGTLFETKTSANVPPGTTWVYDHPFFIILNVAVGGTWPGSPDGSTVFPQTMKVDYVRVYKKK